MTSSIVAAVQAGFEVACAPIESGDGMFVAVSLECEEINCKYVHSTTVQAPIDLDVVVDKLMKAIRASEIRDRKVRL